MLILSRKVGEKIRIGDNIELVISRLSGNRVTLGLSAPKDVKIVRGELQTFTEPPTGFQFEGSLSDAPASLGR